MQGKRQVGREAVGEGGSGKSWQAASRNVTPSKVKVFMAALATAAAAAIILSLSETANLLA